MYNNKGNNKKINTLTTILMMMFVAACSMRKPQTVIPNLSPTSSLQGGNTANDSLNDTSNAGLNNSTANQSALKCEITLATPSAVVAIDSSGKITSDLPQFDFSVSSGTEASQIKQIVGFGFTSAQYDANEIATKHVFKIRASQVGVIPVSVTLVSPNNSSLLSSCQSVALVTADISKITNSNTSNNTNVNSANNYASFGCSATLTPNSQKVQVDASGQITGSLPRFDMLVSTNGYNSRVLSIRGLGLSAQSFDVNESAAVHWTNFTTNSQGYSSVIVTVASSDDSAQIRTCVAQPLVIANQPLPAAPSCSLNLSSTVLRVGDSLVAKLSPQGSATSGKINGNSVAVDGSFTLAPTAVGEFTVKGEVTGAGGTGTCEAKYTVREKCKADYYVNASINARNGVIYDVGGGVAPSGAIANNWQCVGAEGPSLLLSGLKGGDKVELVSISGGLHFGPPPAWWYYVDCAAAGYYPPATNYPVVIPVAQFTNDAKVVQSAPISTQFNTNAMILNQMYRAEITVPEGATRLFGSFPDAYSADNSWGAIESCSLRFHVTPSCN